MNRRFIKKAFPLLAVSLLVPWPVAFAQSYNGDTAGRDAVQIEVAEDSEKPSWSAFGGAIGGVTTPGDLFYIDAGGYPADMVVTLHITNTHELIRRYRYLNLKVGAYFQNSIDQWQKTSGANGELISDTYITLRNGQVSFTLPGYTKYKVTIDSGCFYSFTTNTDGGSLSPQFYLTVD